MINRQFVTAGKAIFTVSNPTGERYTYRVTHKAGTEQYAPVWFVALLTGPDNQEDYTYMGILDAETGAVRLTKKSKYQDDTKAVRVIRWALGIVYNNGTMPEGYAVHHEGRCARCCRPLTVPESVISGFGPECLKKVQCV